MFADDSEAKDEELDSYSISDHDTDTQRSTSKMLTLSHIYCTLKLA